MPSWVFDWFLVCHLTRHVFTTTHRTQFLKSIWLGLVLTVEHMQILMFCAAFIISVCLSSVNIESSVFANVFYLILLVIYVLCKLYHKKIMRQVSLSINNESIPSVYPQLRETL